jgi:hypothetical protein
MGEAMNTRFRKHLLWLGLLATLSAQGFVAQDPLTFEDRVNAQEAIERAHDDPTGDSSASGCGDSAQNQEGWPISSEVYTTRQRAIVPDPITTANRISPWDPSKFKENGYGLWHYVSLFL